MKMKKTSLVAVLVTFLLVGSITVVFATSAIASEHGRITNVANEDGSIQPSQPEPTQQELLERYGDYGISFNDGGKMLFYGDPIRYFLDGYVIDYFSTATHYEYFDEAGTVDVHTTRTVIDNGDGSINRFGALTGIEKYSQDEFEQRNLDNFSVSTNPVVHAIENNTGEDNGITFAKRFLGYKDYGIDYKEKTAGSGLGNVYYNGELVKFFVDQKENGEVFFYTSEDDGKITVHTVYDSDGNLTGVEKR